MDITRQGTVSSEYRGYRFFDKVPLVTRDDQWKGYFDGKFDDISVDIDTDEVKEVIETTINNSMDTVNCKIDNVNAHVEEAKQHLCCDICCAKNEIKCHIDHKIDPIHFEEQFSNLNDQVQTIITKLDNMS